MTDSEIDPLLDDVQAYATRWVESVGHFRTMTDKAFDEKKPYDANDLADDLATLSANFWRDAAGFVNVSSRAMAIVARRGSS